MNNSTDTTSLLDEFNYLHTRAYIPAMVYLVLVIIAGFVSNLFAFLFYTWRAPKTVIHYLISILSLNDVLTNLLLIYDIVYMFYVVNYKNLVTCKIFFFFKHWVVGNSILLILVIAFDRHQRICRPHRKQLTKTMGNYVVIGMILISLFLSVHYLATSAIVALHFTTKTLEAETGHRCSLSTQAPLSVIVDVFHIIDICVHIFVIGAMTLAYILVIKKIVDVKQRITSHNTLGNQVNKSFNDTTTQTDDSFVTENETIGSECNIDNDRSTDTPPVTDADNTQHVARYGKDVERRAKQKMNPSVFHLTGPELKLSIMTFVITVASVPCFVPYYVGMTSEPNMDGKSLIYTVGEIIARRSYILNSAVNPFIMMYFNPSFRKYVLGALCCVCRRALCFKHGHS